MTPRQLQNHIVAALEEIKGRDIAVFPVDHLTALFDYVILCSAESTRQVKALARNVHEQLAERGVKPIGIEGEQSGEWVLVDFGSVVVHVMQPAIRSYYNLEELWNRPKPRRTRKAAAAAA
jgi:ribosome-associated protein